MGFRIAIWPAMGLEAVVLALENAYSALKKQSQSPEDPPLGPGKLFEVCGLKGLMEFDESVGGKAYQQRLIETFSKLMTFFLKHHRLDEISKYASVALCTCAQRTLISISQNNATVEK